MSLLSLPNLGIPCAETQVAVRLQRTHAEFFGQGKGLTVVGVGLFDLWGITLCRDLAKETQGPRLVAALLMLAAGLSSMPRLVQGVPEPFGPQIPFAQRDNAKHMVKDDPHGVGLCHHPLQQRQGLSHTPGQDIRRTQERGDSVEDRHQELIAEAKHR